jgi:anti-sigma factor RsiW
MNPDCERFEIEIGMRQHGALDAGAEAVLDAHLAGCRACRAFAGTSDALTASLKQRARADVAAVDWSEIQGGIVRLRRSYRRHLWLAPIFLLQLPLSALLATGELPPPEMLATMPIMTVGIYLAYVWLVNRPFREIMRVTRRPDDLLAAYARELRRQRLRARVFVALNTALALGCLAIALLGEDRSMLLYGLVCAALFACWAAYDLAVKLPRLGRALAEVSR